MMDQLDFNKTQLKIEFNEKCVKFLGYKYSETYENYNDFYGVWETTDTGVWYKDEDFIENPKPSELYFVKVDGKVLDDYEYGFKFDKDWNWLMKVKDKICLLSIIDEFEVKYDSVAKGWNCHITPSHNNTFQGFYSLTHTTELKATINVIDKFLDWYESVNK